MHKYVAKATVFLAFGTCANLSAQDTFRNWPVQIHGFVSQGFVKSSNNNYLTMNTQGGSFAFTDGGVNATSQVTRRLRVGAQLYVRNIGTLGQWRPTIDWAVAEFKITEWLSARGGKVKTVFGLYNDSQDMESLHTWAILPQSLYPLDLRSSTMAHLGGDLIGEIALPRNLGNLAYTAYAGRRFDDKYGGYRYVARQAGAELDAITGRMTGGDLRWSNGVPGLTIGASYLNMPFEGSGRLNLIPLPIRIAAHRKAHVFYGDYLLGNTRITGEYTRANSPVKLTGIPGLTDSREDTLGWYASVSQRLSSKLEVGTYHSRFVSETTRDWADPDNHIYDTAITARFDINRHWSFKVEGHFMDGYGNNFSARGFYLKQNPSGFLRTTNLLVLRTGYTF